jgi:excisionase family DNA binding protein
VNEPVYTTGEVAKFTGVNFRTVIRWIERGELEGYKLPGRGDHRVTKSSILAFMQQHHIPLPSELSGLGRKALVVDDDLPMANAIARVLKRDGWEVKIANDGFEAGMELAGFKPSLLILDLKMPSMDGYTVLALTRSTPGFEKLKILVISALSKLDLDKAIKKGADEVLEKPFENERLLAIVGNWFTK